MGHGTVIDEGFGSGKGTARWLWHIAQALPGRRALGNTASAELPPLFLFTDERRVPDPLPSIETLPRGAGVVFRHYGHAEREALGRDVRDLCAKRRLVLLVAEDAALATRLGAHGLHLPERALARLPLWRNRFRLCTAAVHSEPGLVRAARFGVSAAFLSPVFATGSHPGAHPIGRVRFLRLTHGARLPVYALGGITAESARPLAVSGIVGFGAIEGLTRRG
jgi:thiamine-phosphate pyrophosphorylase